MRSRKLLLHHLLFLQSNLAKYMYMHIQMAAHSPDTDSFFSDPCATYTHKRVHRGRGLIHSLVQSKNKSFALTCMHGLCCDMVCSLLRMPVAAGTNLSRTSKMLTLFVEDSVAMQEDIPTAMAKLLGCSCES